MQRNSRWHLACLANLALSVLAAAGCGRSKTFDDPGYDSQRAVAALRTTLEAWQQGRVRELPRRDPAIRFVDEDYASGRRLARFELRDHETRIGPFRGVPVLLVLQERGKTVERIVSYQITLDPTISVLRSDP